VQSLYNEQVFSDDVGTFRKHHTSTFQFAAMRKVDQSTGGALTTDSGPSTNPSKLGATACKCSILGSARCRCWVFAAWTFPHT
jgi:hypothetical protein